MAKWIIPIVVEFRPGCILAQGLLLYGDLLFN